MTFNAQLEKFKRRQQVRQLHKDKGLPEQLTDVDELYQPPVNDINFREFKVATDSGAHSLYKEHFVVGDKITAQARINADYSYVKTKEFKKFLDDYIAHCHEYKNLYEFYVTLDIINNPEESWRITEYMESCGLMPMPVFHNGEDICWLEKMVERYPYIGISGLGQDITKAKFKPFGDACFKVICDRHGRPKCQVHGFAMGTPEILKMYPWYSADQSTWTYMARVGSLLVPKPVFQGMELMSHDYLSLYKVIPVTNRRDVEKFHVNNLSESMNRVVMSYLQQNNIDLEAVRESYHWRDVANIRLFTNMQAAAKAWYKEAFDYEHGGNIYFAGTASGAGTNRSRLIKLLHDVEIDTMKWLVTPVYPAHAENVRVLTQAWQNNQRWHDHWDEQQASRNRKSSVYTKIEPRKRKPLLEKVTTEPTREPVKRKPLIVKRAPVHVEGSVTFHFNQMMDVNAYGLLPLKEIMKQLEKDLTEQRISLNPEVAPSITLKLESDKETACLNPTTNKGFFV